MSIALQHPLASLTQSAPHYPSEALSVLVALPDSACHAPRQRDICRSGSNQPTNLGWHP